MRKNVQSGLGKRSGGIKDAKLYVYVFPVSVILRIFGKNIILKYM